MIGLEALGLYAIGAVAASYGLGVAMFGAKVPAVPATKKTPLRVAVARERAIAKRIVVPEKVALCVVEYLRSEGLHAYPLIPEDLDDEINHWCDTAGVERVSTQHVRELIALLPGVSRDRIRPHTSSPKNRAVRARMVARGRKIGEKVTVYTIADTPWVAPEGLTQVCPVTVQPAPTRGPTRARPVRTSDQKRARKHDPKETWADIVREAA